MNLKEAAGLFIGKLIYKRLDVAQGIIALASFLAAALLANVITPAVMFLNEHLVKADAGAVVAFNAGEFTQELTVYIAFGLVLLFNYFATKLPVNWIKKIQFEDLGFRGPMVDGLPLKKTTEAVKELSLAANLSEAPQVVVGVFPKSGPDLEPAS